MKEYGYKVCYKLKGKNKIKIYVITDDKDFTLLHIRWYEKELPKDRKTNKIIQNAEWFVLPISNYLEYKWLWRGCPF